MTDVTYDAPHRTETQKLGDDIAQAMRNLRRDWPHMLRPGETQAPGMASRSGVTLDDHATSDADQRRIDRTISLRRFAVDLLNSWSRVVMEDRGITNPATLPIGNRVEGEHGMATFLERHADWMSGHEAAQDARDELVDLAHRCHLVAFPTRRESISIGRCPLEVPGEQDVLAVCGGDVRARTSDAQRIDGKVWAACNRCGEVAPSDWWAERMFVDGEASPLVTTAELIAVIAYRLEVVVTHEQVRQWKSRGKIQSAGVDGKGRTLYRHGEVIDAIRADVRARATRRPVQTA